MITRIYVDNYKTFGNFECSPGKLALFMGPNGSGKSALAEVLWAIRDLVLEGHPVSRLFPGTCRSRWDRRHGTRVEIDLFLDGADDDPDHLLRYQLDIEHDPEHPTRSRIKREVLDRGAHTVLELIDGTLEVFSDDGSSVAKLTLSTTRSALAAVAAAGEQGEVGAFKRWLATSLSLVRPDPRAMSGRVDERCEALHPSMDNFASWYATTVARDITAAFEATRALRGVLPGFDCLRVSRTSERLEAVFARAGGGEHALDFEALSDGERQLCALYFVWFFVRSRAGTIIFDGVENHVALREIQPWLTQVVDVALSPHGPQVWFLSHHPEIVDQLAPSHGVRFERHGAGPTRIEPLVAVDGLSPSETVARGWDHG